MEQYRREEPFREGWGEFDEARATVMGCVQEYEEAEGEGYLSGDKGGETTDGAAAS